jgi:hypothetical protein
MGISFFLSIISTLFVVGAIALLSVQLFLYPELLLPVFRSIKSKRNMVEVIEQDSKKSPISEDIWQLVKALEKGYQEKNIHNIQMLLSSSFRYNGMNASQFLSAVEKTFLFSECTSSNFEVIDFHENHSETSITFLFKTNIVEIWWRHPCCRFVQVNKRKRQVEVFGRQSKPADWALP